MRRRWSLFARLAAILTVGLFIVQLMFVWSYRNSQELAGSAEYRFPLPERVLAMVTLFEETEDRDRLLVALNSDDLRVFVSDDAADAFLAEDVRLPGIEAVLEEYVEQFDGRKSAAFVALPSDVEPASLSVGDRSVFSTYPARIAVELRSGGTLVIETRDDLLTKVFQLPIGFFAGVVAVFGALVMLFAIGRETRPLRDLAAAMRGFGSEGIPVDVMPAGAQEVRELTDDFNAMQKQINTLLTGRSVMLGALGHDLRTYLSRMKLKIDTLPDETRLSLDRDIDTMDQVLENCLMLARGHQSQRPRDIFYIGDETGQIVGEYGAAVMEPIAFEDEQVVFEKAAFRRVMTNVLDNAVKFAGSCKVTLTCEGSWATVTVSDQGPGMSAEDLALAFDPFSRGDGARTLDRRGTGIGLSIAQMLADANDAKIHLESALNLGTTVNFTVPVYQSESDKA